MGQLDGVKIVDLSTYIAAPSCGRILASYGADVIKVESPKGDDLRKAQVSYGYPAETDEYSWGMDVQNANKKGLCLNLRTPEGIEAMYKLLETADVFLTNNRVQALVKMGLDWDTLHAKFPRLIHASILGYGENGPLKDKPGFDYTSQEEVSLTHLWRKVQHPQFPYQDSAMTMLVSLFHQVSAQLFTNRLRQARARE